MPCAGGWQVSGTYQYQSGFPLTFSNNIYWDASCGDPSSLVSNIGEKVSGGIAGLDVPGWDTTCFYFHDAAVQTNGVDDPAKQRTDPRINLEQQRALLPVDACRTCGATICTCSTSGSTRTSRCRAR